MKHPGKIIRLSAALLAFSVHSGLSFAGTAQVAGEDDTSVTYEYTGEMVRMSTNQGDNSHMIFRDGRLYMVSYSDGAPLVIDASQSLSMARSLGGANTATGIRDHRVLSLEAAGKTEEHAGVKGQVYTIRVKSADGEVEENEIVLTDDPKAIEYRDAMLSIAEQMRKALGKPESGNSDGLENKLRSMNKGVLRYGDDMKVTALSNAAVDPSRFELPAEPMDLSGIGAILSGIGQAGATQNPEADTSENAGAAANPMNELGKTLGELFKR